jgi:hypothetical protein
MAGAVGMVCYGGPVEAPAQHFDDPGFLDFEEAVLHLDRYLLVEDGSESYEFNDAKGRRVEDVVLVLRQAADTSADELIDAIRAIDARNAETAALVDLLKPRGVWGETTSASSMAAPVTGPEWNQCWCTCPDEADTPMCPDTRPCAHCAQRHTSSHGRNTPGGDVE